MSTLNFNVTEVLEIHTSIGKHPHPLPQWLAAYYVYGISNSYGNLDIKTSLSVKLLNSSINHRL